MINERKRKEEGGDYIILEKTKENGEGKTGDS